MKLSTIYLDNLVIEIHIQFFFQEIVNVNGQSVSKKYTVLGAGHRFTHNGQNYKLELIRGFLSYKYDLYRDNIPVIVSAKRGCFFFMLITFISILLTILFQIQF